MLCRAVALSVLSACALAPLAAKAQSSLGFRQVEAAIGATGTQGDLRAGARLSADLAITAAHGLQFDLSLADQPAGMLGAIDAHLYLTPRPDRSYGLFGHLSDLDGTDSTTVAAGAEARLALGARARAEVKAGIGVRNPGSFDFLFVEGWAERDLSPRVTLIAGAMAADYDEPGFSATGWQAEAGLRLALAPNAALEATVGHSGLAGADGDGGEGFARLGLTVSFGGGRDGARLFRPARPLAPLQLRGLE